jgi:peptide/nickel transport system permease protein
VLTLLGRRFLVLIPLLFVVSIAIFGLVVLVPGDAAVTLAGGPDATPERIAQVRDELGLDDPFLTQYGRWLGDAVTGDFGTSLQSNQSVVTEIKDRLPVTLSVALAALVVALCISIPAGIISGLRPGGIVDRLALLGSSMGIAIPGFWLAMILVTLFAIQRHWFPAIGFTPFGESPYNWAKGLVLPGVSLGLLAAASQTRQLRGALLDVLDSNYVRTGWAKGGSPRWVIGKHALKNAAIPAVTVLGLQTSALLGSSVIVEQIFSIPGLGTYLIRAIQSQDLPVIQGVVVFFVLMNVLINLLVDLTYGYLNPKVRVG